MAEAKEIDYAGRGVVRAASKGAGTSSSKAWPADAALAWTMRPDIFFEQSSRARVGDDLSGRSTSLRAVTMLGEKISEGVGLGTRRTEQRLRRIHRR